MKQLLLTAIAVAGLALSANAANAQNLVKNGDFEQSAHGAPEGFINLGVAQSYGQAGDITDWTIGGGESKLSLYMNNANATTVGASTGGKFTLPTSFLDVANLPGDTLATGAVQKDPNGGYFMALDGNSAGTNASISQTVSGLTIGKTYDLKFVWAGIQLQQYSGATTESLVVSFGNQSQSTQVLNEGTHDFSGWITQNMEFVATAASQTLTFLSIGTPGGNPPMSLLDGISLTEAPVVAVPEPSTYALMFGGLGLIGLSLNRRRKSSQVADRTVA